MRILKIQTLPSVKEVGWEDRDRIMLHSCFQILVDFVEKENGIKEWGHENHREIVEEMKYLYEWWIKYIELLIIDEDVEQEHLERLIKVRSYLWT